MPESLVPDPISLSLHASQVSKQVVAFSSSLSCSMRHLIDNSGLGTIVTGHQFQRICQLAVPPNLVEKPANAVSKPASFWPTVRGTKHAEFLWDDGGLKLRDAWQPVV